MPNRYKTKAEIEGAKRRLANSRKKAKDAGLFRRELKLTNEEFVEVKEFIAKLRTSKRSI